MYLLKKHYARTMNDYIDRDLCTIRIIFHHFQLMVFRFLRLQMVYNRIHSVCNTYGSTAYASWRCISDISIQTVHK
jgi:hypothetical protein